MKRYALLFVFCVLGASAAFAQTKNSVEGVWKVAEVVLPDGNPAAKGTPTTNSNAQPGLLIFTKAYYSGMGVEGRQPRAAVEPAKDPKNLTDAEKIARYEQWRPFIANAGTYEINGSMLSMHATVAKNVITRDRPNVWEFKLEGSDTLWLIPTGDRAATEPRVKLMRLE
jgi:hypothetical protein